MFRYGLTGCDTEGLTGGYRLPLFSGSLLSLGCDAVVITYGYHCFGGNAAATFRITSTLDTEATYQSKTLIANCHTTRCHKPEDNNDNNCRSKKPGRNLSWPILRPEEGKPRK